MKCSSATRYAIVCVGNALSVSGCASGASCPATRCGVYGGSAVGDASTMTVSSRPGCPVTTGVLGTLGSKNAEQGPVGHPQPGLCVCQQDACSSNVDLLHLQYGWTQVQHEPQSVLLETRYEQATRQSAGMPGTISTADAMA